MGELRERLAAVLAAYERRGYSEGWAVCLGAWGAGWRAQAAHDVWSAFSDWQRARGYPPSVRELAQELGVSPATALRWLRLLEYCSVVERRGRGPRCWRLRARLVRERGVWEEG